MPKRRPDLGIVLIIVALVANAVTGVFLIVGRSGDDDRDARFQALVSCLTIYNQENAAARDARTKASGQTLDAQIKYTEQLVSRFEQNPDSLQDLTSDSIYLADLRAYLRSLKETKKTQIDQPYPAPDRCARLAR